MLKPDAYAVANRTAMIGGGLSYDVWVETRYVVDYDAARHTTICSGGKEYWDFVHATMPLSHYAMPLGHKRYEHFLAHETRARKVMLAHCKRLFPELASYTATDYLPSLWVTGLMDDETSATITFPLT